MLVIRSPRILIALVALFTAGIFLARPAIAHAAGVDEESQFILNTFAFLIWGALVMWMCAGFTMLESGSVRTKNASTICLKNIGIYSIAGLAFLLHRLQPDVHGRGRGGVVGEVRIPVWAIRG